MYNTTTDALNPESDGFSISIQNLDLQSLQELGGIKGVASRLQTDTITGITRGDVEERKKLYGENRFVEKEHDSWLDLVWKAFQDTTIIILSTASIISIVCGILTQFFTKPTNSWIEGIAILVAVMIVVIVTATNDYQKQKQFRELRGQYEDHRIRVIRNSTEVLVSIFDIVVGDVCVLHQGDKIPADGLFIRDLDDLHVDQSSITGESKHTVKSTTDPFLFAGCVIFRGSGNMVVTAVGMNTLWGKALASMNDVDIAETPLQKKLENLAVTIGKIGTVAAVLVFIVLLIYWVLYYVVDPHEAVPCSLNSTDNFNITDWINDDVETKNKTLSSCDLGTPVPGRPGEMYVPSTFHITALLNILEAFIVAVTIIVVAVPEGLPLAVTIALAYSMKLMAEDNNLVRHLAACETMGGATAICTDKTGTLTLNKMSVVTVWIGGKLYSMDEFPSDHPHHDLLIRSCCLNIEDAHLEKRGRSVQFVGNTTECALLQLCANQGIDYKLLQKSNRHVKKFSFTSDRKRMSTILSEKSGSVFRLYCKGAAEMVLGLCTRIVDLKNGPTDLSNDLRKDLQKIINKLSAQGLRTLCVAYRDFPNTEDLSNNDEDYFEKNLTCIGLLAIEDPLRPEVPDAVLACKNAGVTVRMVTGDNLSTAKKIAEECNILTPDGMAIDGDHMSKLSDAELDAILPKLQVLARVSPLHKLRLVKRLQDCGDVVAVTGDGTNDAPALRQADVGLAMNITGTDVAKEAADILILDDNFASIVNSILWGRCVYDNIRKFLQFQLTVNAVALIVAFVGAVTNMGTPLTAVQLLWVNLIMDSLAALALGTEKPTRDLLLRKPYGREGKLITAIMIRNIVFQSIFQLIVLFIILFAFDENGYHVLFTELKSGKDAYEIGSASLHYTFLFNTFVFCQLFNEVNSRKVSPGLNPFVGIFTNKIFVSIFFGIIIVQIGLVSLGIAMTVPLPMDLWLYSIAIGSLGIPIGYLVRLVKVPLEPWEVVAEQRSTIYNDDVDSGLASPRQTIRTEEQKNKHFKKIEPYQESSIGAVLMGFAILFTGGILGIVALWSYRVRYFFKKKCSVDEATTFLIETHAGKFVPVEKYPTVGTSSYRFYIDFEGVRFVWQEDTFEPVDSDIHWTFEKIRMNYTGMTATELSKEIYTQYGQNIIHTPDVMLIEDILHAFLSPIQVYQYFCFTVWYLHGYPAFSTVILCGVVLTSIANIIRTRKSRDSLRELTEKGVTVNARRDNAWQLISSKELLPGDVIQVPDAHAMKHITGSHQNFIAPCDLVVTSGSVVLNESAVTGESLPVVKAEPPSDSERYYNAETDKSFTMYCDTEVLSVEPRKHQTMVLATVVRTAWRSSKGQLIKCIVGNKPARRFQREAEIFQIVFSILGIFLSIFSWHIWHVFTDGVQQIEQLVYGFEAFACLYSPVLPLIYQMVTLVSAERLEKEKKIHTTNPSIIPYAGKVKTMCFDKTGTLTKSDLDVIGVVTANDKFDLGTCVSVDSLSEEECLLHALATCHSLSALPEVSTHKYSGPLIDLKMFGATGWTYSEKFQSPKREEDKLVPLDGNEDYDSNIGATAQDGETSYVVSPKKRIQMNIIKRFEFDSSLQRMSVITEFKGQLYAFAKGSAEAVRLICDPSTVPPAYEAVVKKLSKSGCYVLALACRKVQDKSININKQSSMHRKAIEDQLQFLGLLVLRNELKEDTPAAISQLKEGLIKTVMITGDSVYTALTMAQLSGMAPANTQDCFIGEYESTVNRVIFRHFDDSNLILDCNTWTINRDTSAPSSSSTSATILRRTSSSSLIRTTSPSGVYLGVTTAAFDHLKRKEVDRTFMINHVNVFARMRPLQKQEAVSMMRASGDIVGMCGDGTNDSAALNSAHFGVALSLSEASLIAPFTAKNLSIGSVVELVKEGRACLANYMAVFKWSVIFGVIQTSVMFLSFFFGADLSQGEYIVQDLLTYFVSLMCMIYTTPAPRLRGNPPTSKIFGPKTIASVFGPLVVTWVSLGFAVNYLKKQPWFSPHHIGTAAVYELPETTTLWIVSLFLFPACYLAMSFGSTWRQSIFRNIPLMIVSLFGFLYVIFFVGQYEFLKPVLTLMEVVTLPADFRLTLSIIGLTAAASILVWERVFVIGPVGNFLHRITNRGRAPSHERQNGWCSWGDSFDDEDDYVLWSKSQK